MKRRQQHTFEIIEKIREFPGVHTGIVELDDVLNGLSYRAGSGNGGTTHLSEDRPPTPWLPHARWVLVLGLHHSADNPALDWWEGGNTRGNRRLMDITAFMEDWFFRELGMKAQSLPYAMEHGGLFQKDAAVLSGIGIVGRNNLLVHPEWGPQIRFRSMLVAGDLEPTPSLEGFDPCRDCKRYCQKACPQRAFPQGRYNRSRCMVQMQLDIDQAEPGDRTDRQGKVIPVTKYCRACELACPVGLPEDHMKSFQ